MANNVIENYSFNVQLGNYQILNAVQGEVNTRYVQVNFTNNNSPYDLTGLFVTLNMIKSDNTVIFDNGTIIDASNGIAQFLISSEMCVLAGTFNVFFKIYGNTPTSELKVTGFQLVVEPANNDSGIESSNEFTALQTLIGEVQPALNNMSTAITNCNTQTATAVANCNTAIANTNIAITNTNAAADLATKAANILYDSLYIDPLTAELKEDIPDNYVGITDFSLNSNGELEVTI